MRPFTTKSEWYRYFNSGIFNTTRSWSGQDFVTQSKEIPDALFGIRSTAHARKHIVIQDKNATVYELLHWKSMGQLDTVRVFLKAPDEAIVLQGEFDGINVEATTCQKIMRHALEEERLILSRFQLRHKIGWEAYQELIEWSDLYPGHVIEFSYYSQPVGVHNKPLVIWEIRKY